MLPGHRSRRVSMRDCIEHFGSAAVAWMVFSCATGHGGLINYFLSMKVFDYLSKLSYSVYLLHFLVLWSRYASIRYPLPFSHYTLFCEFITNWLLSTFVAIVVHLTLESPLLKLYRVLTTSESFAWADISLIRIKRKPIKNCTRLWFSHDFNHTVCHAIRSITWVWDFFIKNYFYSISWFLTKNILDCILFFESLVSRIFLNWISIRIQLCSEFLRTVTWTVQLQFHLFACSWFAQ